MRSYEFVTNTPIKLDRHKSLLVDDVAVVRRTPSVASLSPPSTTASSSIAMIERCVVVQRQTDGFGLVVSEEYPVFVREIKTDGAAYCAGVRQGDRIIKVNGMTVTMNNHTEVIRMISNGQNVALTLLGKPPDPLPPISISNSKFEQKIHINDPVLIEASSKDWRLRRKELLGEMMDEEKRHIEGLRESSQNVDKIDRALKRIVSLQSQLKHIKPITNEYHKTLTNLPMDIDSDEDENDVYLPETQGGPFSNLAELKTHPAHLAVFINYLLSNGNPSSLFFYLITDAYQSAYGTAKEFRRWAFEIFSTFIIPNSPMCIPNSDQSIIQPIDKIMCITADHIGDSDADTLKRVFVPGRQRAVADINMYLNDFRQKKQLGGQISESANQLTHMVRGDMAMEHRVGEQMLFRALEQYSSPTDFDNCEIKTQAIISSLTTVIKIVLGKTSTSTYEKLLDKFPQFIARDKPQSKTRKLPANMKNRTQVKGHTFSINSVNTVHYCYQCRDAIWGMQPWIYFCSNCDVKVHPQCTSSLTDACYPMTQTKTKVTKSRLSGLIGRSDNTEEDEPSSNTYKHDPSNVKSTSSDSGIGNDSHNHDRNIIARSNSMRYRMSTIPQSVSEDKVTVPKRDRSSNWQSRTPGHDLTPADETDEEAIRERRMKIIENSTSRSVESSNRMAIDLQSVSGASSCSHHSHPTDDEIYTKKTTTLQFSTFMDGDSDFELETEATPLEQLIGWDVIRHLKPKEKKRQEVINELFHTERTHVRNLKILYHVFYKPLANNNKLMSDEVTKLLFANLEDLLNLHKKMSDAMRAEVQKWRTGPPRPNGGIYGNIGDLMESMFDGEAAAELMEITSTFCQHQQHALEFLRSRCKRDKDDYFVRFLSEAESNPVCRKLQLKDMIPVEMQRLVKYPLLLETIAKYTTEPSEEQDKLLKTVTSAKKILSAVNTAKRNAENYRRLEELQRRIDTTPFDKEFSGHDYASLNLTKYRLVHDGPLTCRFNRGKMVELHVVLLENMLVLLTRHSDGNKLQLKTLEPSKETKWSPIFPLSPLIAKEKANDKRAFFLIFNSQYGAQIYELVAGTATERKTWFKLMSDQIEQEKKHQTIGIEPNFEVGQTTLDSDGIAKVNVSTHPRLVNANEITIQQPTILEHAQPVLTPAEKLKRSDEIILQTLLAKQTILSQFLLSDDAKGKPEELEKLAELLSGLAVTDLKQRDGRELAMSAIVHGNRLLDSINQSLNIRRDYSDDGRSIVVLENQEPNVPSVPSYKLTTIAAPLMNHLKALMQVIQDQQNELNVVKQQLLHYKKIATENENRSVSEETLTDCVDERKLMTKRQRLPSIQPMT
ncbi:unnamed protein product [Caenorhabditis angaria]|uniref:Uncharacterized protein n=1 Tax=Caenorhabditis angaria TaxID=860376 RepID=A0A9P1IXX2_9PELO|nr:unnamed protein product [Caenorhabditis angaria]